jgi:hypothetical protein
MARRMTETVAHLVDHVFPSLPVRQWVISFPKPLRYFLHRDPGVRSAALRIVLRGIEPALREQSPAAGPSAQIGAVWFRKVTGRNPATRAPVETVPPEQAQTELRDLRKAVEALATELRQRRPARGPAKDQRQAIDVILKHTQDHGPTLWGHVVALPEQAGGAIRVVDRIHCRLQSRNGELKHSERRRSGRKKLTQDLENLPPGAPVAFNLRDPDYVALLCGALERLPAAFAALDGEARTRELDGPQTQTTPALFASPTGVETASLPKRDRHLVRSEALQRCIRAAARSRAPRTSGRHACRRPTED